MLIHFNDYPITKCRIADILQYFSKGMHLSFIVSKPLCLEALKKLNSDYEAKRFNNYVLHFPKLVVATKGTFLQWLESKNKLGGQNKVPRLCNERKYVEEIKKVISEQ